MLADQIFTTPPIDAIFSATAELRCLLRMESALATAQGKVGVIPRPAAQSIAAVCDQTDWDSASITEQTLKAGNPVIPFVQLLKQRVAVRDPEAAAFAHWGATSQDLIDTTLMLQLTEAFTLISADLRSVQNLLNRLLARHGEAPMMGRTLLQQALPITFGHKVTGWLDGLTRAGERLERICQHELVIQLGGPVGNLAEMGEQGFAIRQRVAEALGLRDAAAWHTQRDRIADIAAMLGTLNGSLGKLATDVILLMQSEVDEIREGAEPGKGGSSAMPHKRNPVSATFMVAIAHQTPALLSILLGSMLQAHERAAGAWHSEWPVVRQLVRLTAANLRHANDLFADLEVDTDRMRRNMGR